MSGVVSGHSLSAWFMGSHLAGAFVQSLLICNLFNTLTVSDENTRHKMGLPGR